MIEFTVIICFLSSQECLNIIHHKLNLFYDICNIITEYIHRQTHYLHLFFKPNLIPRKKWLKKLFYNLICFLTNHNFHVITLWMHYTLFINIFRRNKGNCYCWLNFLRIKPYILSLKYDLTLLRYSSIDSVLFLPSLLSSST